VQLYGAKGEKVPEATASKAGPEINGAQLTGALIDAGGGGKGN